MSAAADAAPRLPAVRLGGLDRHGLAEVVESVEHVLGLPASRPPSAAPHPAGTRKSTLQWPPVPNLPGDLRQGDTETAGPRSVPRR